MTSFEFPAKDMEPSFIINTSHPSSMTWFGFWTADTMIFHRERCSLLKDMTLLLSVLQLSARKYSNRSNLTSSLSLYLIFTGVSSFMKQSKSIFPR